MSFESDPLFPEGLSDEAATALCDFLFELATAADARFLAQILRYRRQHQNPPLDPDHTGQSA